MKPLAAIALALVASLPLSAQGTSPSFDFSIRNMMRGPELYGRAPQRVRWSADGRWIHFAWNPPGTKWSEPLWNYRVRAVSGAKPERLTAAQFDSAGPLLADGSYSADRRSKAVAHDGDLYLIDARSSRVRRLTQTIENESSPTMTASGTGVYFVRDNNVYHFDVNAALIRQVTNVRAGPAPSDSTFRGQRGALRDQQQSLFDALREDARRDSVAREERRARDDGRPRAVYLRAGERLAQISISPHGNALLFTTVIPARGTRQTEVPAYVTASGYTEPLRVRTKVGDEQGDGRVALLRLDGTDVQWLSPGDSNEVAGGGFIAGWNDAGNSALIITYTRDNKRRLIQRVDTSGAISTVDALRDSAWVLRGCGGNACGTRAGWLEGNRVWYTSEADGFAHLYVANGDGTGRQQLTRGSWEILDVTLDAARRSFFLTTSENSPFDAQVYRMAVTGGARTRITPQPGSHDVAWSPDETMGANVHSFSNRPPELYLIRNRPNEQELAQLTTSTSTDWRSFDWKVPEIVMIPASDGKQVPARIYKPQAMNAAPNGAAVIFVHGAGYLHNVGNFWSPYPREYMFNHFLASHGYVVLDIDYRGSAGYGRDWRTAIYRWMGGRDLQDQVDGSKYLQREFGIHPERIGMYGGSYGGFMTLMALFTEPRQFGAGAALRSVTDWAHYNHGYTSNILNTPQADTLAYRRSSPIFFAEGLEDPLLMAHGMVDVNVHFQDIVRLSQRLIELGKEDWELAVYPVEDHGFVRPDSWTDEYTRIFKLFERSIGANGSKANSRSDRQ